MVQSTIRFLVLVQGTNELGVSVTSDPQVLLWFASEAAETGQRCSIIPYDVRSATDPDGLLSDVEAGSRV